jgi:hypothetical protein
LETFPSEPVVFLSKVIIGDLEPIEGFWLGFERKVLFNADNKLTLAEKEQQKDKQVNLILYCFILAKILGARFLVAQQEPSLFPGVPAKELPYLKLCGLTCIALLTDIICDLYKNDLAG